LTVPGYLVLYLPPVSHNSGKTFLPGEPNSLLDLFWDSAYAVAKMLQNDLFDLSQLITISKMKLNLNKSSVMWFSLLFPNLQFYMMTLL